MQPEGATATLADLVPAASEIVEQITKAKVAQEAARGSVVSCTKGCGACCRYLVRVSIPEAFWLHARFLELPPEDQARYGERIAEIQSALRDSGLDVELAKGLTRGANDPSHEFRHHELSRRYLALGLACPFLEEESCSIHPWRPVVCRQYLVTSPAPLCVDPFGNNVRRTPMPFHATETLSELAGELLGKPPELIPLPMALDWAAENEPLARLEWPGEELFARLRGAFHRPIQPKQK